MKKSISLILAFLMMVITFVGVFPPLEVSAATAASISSLKASPDEAYEGDSVQVKGTVKSGSYYLRAIQINVRNEGDDDHGFRVDRIDFDYSDKKTSYSLSKLDKFEIGSYTCSGCGRKESLDVGEHRIDIHVGLYDSDGDEAEGFTKSVWIEVLEEEPPYVKDIDADVDGTEVEFTVKTNLTAKHGIVLYADGYELDMIDWDMDTYSSYIKYTGSHVFNQVGERNITVYALDADGDIVDDSEDSTTIDIISIGPVSPPSITTSNNQKIEVGNSFKLSWNKPTTPTGVTFKYNVYLNNGTTNTLVAENLTTTSYTIPASKLNKAGTYTISVIAMATDYTQSDDDDASINLTVTEVQENPDLTSVSGSVNGTVSTFTVKGNADAKYGIVLYADGYKLDMISWSKSGTSTVTYTGSHAFNQTGTRNIEVYALDKDGNEVPASEVTTTVNIISLGECGAPSITTSNNQKIEVGNSFKISWNKPTTPTGVTFKYNVYLNNGTTNTLVAENLTTTTCTIPASKLSKAGTYVVSVIAMATDYTQSDDDDASINLTVTEVQENPDLTSVSGSVNGTVATFTVKGNADAKYGIVLYADGYKLDMISWSKSGTSTVTYTGSHTFNQTGTRNIEVYALDNDGDEVSGSKVTTTVNIVSLGKCGAPSITTTNNQKIEIGNSFTISWNKPSEPIGVTFKYNVYVWDGTNNTLVSENLTTTTCTIPASKLSKAGTYVVSVIAMATGYTQSDDDDAAINLTVNGAEKTIVGYNYYSSVLRHRVEYSDGSYEMEDCQQGMCVCGRPYKVDHNAEQTPIEYAWFKDNMKHHVVYANGTDAIEDCASVDCVCGRPSTVVENPSLIEVKAVASGMTGFFTVKGNADAKYGIVLYADGYKLDKIVWIHSESNGTITYTGEHIFNQPGTRNIVVYALDKDGNEVKSDGKFASTSIVLEPDGRCDSPIITTINNQKIEVGNSFKVSWNKPATPAGVTFKYNVYVNNGTTNVCVAEQISATSYTIPANKLNKAGVYTISVIAMATGYQQSDDDDAAINLTVVANEIADKITLTTPRVSGSSKIQYGDDYTISWDSDAQVDYYQITIDGLNYKKTVNATEKSFTIPGSVFKQYSGADTNYTISLVAMSHDTEKYLPSEAATIRVNVAGYSESNALIKSAEILDGNEIIAGTVVRFKVVTTKDVTALRMKDGAGSFIVNTWYASEIGTNSSNAQYYKDSGDERTWYIQQKVNHAGDANAAGAKRLLTFYSMVNEVEYNNCSVSFYCKKGNDVIGKFEITSPSNNAMLLSGKDVVINWSAPTNTTVDYYIVDIYHGDVRVESATVNGTTYTLAGTLLEKDSVAWQIRVTARKDDGQWAESVATASFKLECTHEHLGQPTENILSYAQKNDTTHSCVVEKTYACLDCGLANAKKAQETVTKLHNWITLDKGGKVCNQCWHLQSDDSFTAKKDMQLSSLAGNREFVYFNVDASGNPANKQNGRYVDKTDKITILGEVGNCYLIEYPIPSGVHWGFIDSDLVGEPQDVNHTPIRTYEQQRVDEFVQKFIDGELSVDEQKVLFEYICADGIAEEIRENLGLAKCTYVVTRGITGQVEMLANKLTTELFGADSYYQRRILKTFLNKVIEEMPVDEEISIDIKETDDYIEHAKKVKELLDGITDGITDEKSLQAQLLAADKKINNVLNDARKLGVFEDVISIDQKSIHDFVDGLAGELNDTIFEYWSGMIIDYSTYTKFKVVQGLQYYELLLELFPDEESQNTIKAEMARYVSDSFEWVTYTMNYVKDKGYSVLAKYATKGIFHFLSEKIGLKAFGKISTVDSILQVYLKITGVEAYADGSNSLIYFNAINNAIRCELVNCACQYYCGDDSAEMANRIVALFDLSRACQIYINKNALSVTNDLNKKTILNDELSFLNSLTMENWSLNPYYAPKKQEKPDVTRFNAVELGYYYKILLEGYSNRDNDGLLGGWSKMSDYEKQLVIVEVDQLYDFAQGKLEKIMFLEVGNIHWARNEGKHVFDHEGIALIFINNKGEGLLIRYFDNIHNVNGSGDPGYDYTTFNVLSKDQVDGIIAGNAELPIENFAIQRHTRLGYKLTQFDKLTDGQQSIVFVDSDKGQTFCMTGYTKYFALNVSKAQAQTILDEVLSYDNYDYVRAHQNVFDTFISDVWNVWIWDSSYIDYIAEKFNSRADKTNDASIKATIVESNWDD